MQMKRFLRGTVVGPTKLFPELSIVTSIWVMLQSKMTGEHAVLIPTV